jgi:hypothetical protein
VHLLLSLAYPLERIGGQIVLLHLRNAAFNLFRV